MNERTDEEKKVILRAIGWVQAGDDGDEWWPPPQIKELQTDMLTVNLTEAYRMTVDLVNKLVSDN